MYCQNCGKQLPDGSSFCSYCGEKQQPEGVHKESKRKKLVLGLVFGLAAVLVLTVCVFVAGRKGKTGETKTASAEAPIKEEKEQDASKKEEQTAEKTVSDANEVSESVTLGSVVVERGSRIAALGHEELILYEDNQEVWSTQGIVGRSLMMTENGLYYAREQSGTSVEYYDFQKGTQSVVLGNYSGMEPVGVDGDRLYVKAARQEDMDDHMVLEKNLQDGSVRELAFTDMWGNFGIQVCSGKLYYIGGRTDVSTSPLYEGDPVTGNAVILEERAAAGPYAVGSKLYYVQCDEPGYNYDSIFRVKERDVKTGETKTLVQDTYRNLGLLCGAEENYLLFNRYSEEESGCQVLDLTSGNLKKVDNQGEMNCMVVGTDLDGVYVSAFSGEYVNSTWYPPEVYHVYYYNYATGQTKEVGAAPNVVVGAADGYIYYAEDSSLGNSYTRAAFGNTVNETRTVPKEGDSGERDDILPGSDSRYYHKLDLEGLTPQQIRIARNEIYARHGYIFNSQDLQEYFSEKSWYYPSIAAEDFNEGMLNQIERANLDMIKEYEENTGINQ